MGAQVYSPTRTTALKVLLKIYFLYDYRCAQTCSFRAISGLPMRTLTIAARKQFTLLIDQKVEIFTFLGRVPTRVHRLPWNFAWPSGPTCRSATPNFKWLGATSHPCGANRLIFGLLSKNNTGSLQLRGILPVTSGYYPRRARSVSAWILFSLWMYVCMYVSALERKRLIGMTWNSEP